MEIETSDSFYWYWKTIFKALPSWRDTVKKKPDLLDKVYDFPGDRLIKHGGKGGDDWLGEL